MATEGATNVDKNAQPPLGTEAEARTADVDPQAAKDDALASRAWSGSLATVAAHVGGNVIRLGSNLALTRLLMPEHFGTMALVSIIVQGLHMFSDLGIGPSIVQHAHGERPRFVHTAFTIQVLRGLWLFLGSSLLAWPMARFYEIAELIWMVPVAGFTALIDGFTSTKIFRENRHLRLGRIGAIEVATQLIAAITMVALAVATGSVVALLAGSIVAALVRIVLSHLALPGFADGFAWDADARKELLSFGRWVFISTAITFVAMQLDRIMLGKLVSADLLGIYSIAVMLAAVPREVIGQVIQRVLYPMVADAVRSDAGSELIRTMRTRILYLLVVPLGVLAGEAEALFAVLYDERYRVGGALMAYLCLGTWLGVLGSTYGVVVLSKGWPKWISLGTGLKTLTIGGLMTPVHAMWGLPGVALLIGCAEAAVALSTCWGCRGLGVITFTTDAALTLLLVVIGIAVHLGQQQLTLAAGTGVAGLALFGLSGGAAALAIGWRLGMLDRFRTA